MRKLQGQAPVSGNMLGKSWQLNEASACLRAVSNVTWLGSIEEKNMALNNSPLEKDRKLKQLLEEHYYLMPGMVKSICFSLWYECGLQEQADLCQGAYLYFEADNCRQLSSFRNESSFGTFLYGALRNYVRKEMRKRQRWISWEDEKLDLPGNEVGAEEKLLAESDLEALSSAVYQLPKRKQELFWLLWEGITEKEIAERMKVKIETVYSYKSETIDNLQALLKVKGRAKSSNRVKAL